MLIREKSKVVFKKITPIICTLYISEGTIKNKQSRDTGNIGQKIRKEEKQKKKNKKCDIDYMSVN